jgi:hypothetical protein
MQELVRRGRAKGVKFQIQLRGGKSNVDSLGDRLRLSHIQVAERGPRYHIVSEAKGSWYLSAVDLSANDVKAIESALFEQAKSPSVTRLTVTNRNSVFDVQADPQSQFRKFIEKPDRFIFVRFEDVLNGCLACLENAEELASGGLLCVNTPRIAITLVSYAFEELGKAALLF